MISIIRLLAWGDPVRQASGPAPWLLFNKQMKTDVWALVGIVDHDYSDTTSDSLIHVIFDFELCLSLRFGC